MFKKIQKYLLLNYPLLWNTKVIPTGAIVIGFNVLFFLLGFVSGYVDFQNQEYYRRDNNIIFFLITGLTSTLVMIIWLVFYLKNNAFKSFYPKKAVSLYQEWGIAFLLLFGNCLYSFSYTQGVETKEKSYASLQEVLNARELLTKIEILLPESDDYYYLHKASFSDSDSIQAKDSISVSLLNFEKYYHSAEDTLLYNTVKKWLVEGQQDSIRNLMTQYLNLQKKHNVTTNLDVDTWMKLIYNPPNFPVSPSNYIKHYKSSYDTVSKYYVRYDTLYYGYLKIYDAYHNLYSMLDFILVTLYIALSLSILLFSFRVTGGRSWLISIVVAGLLAFINGIITAIFTIVGNSKGDNLLYLTIFYWSVLFLIMLIYVGRKILNTDSKGKSTVVLNLILWMLPYLLMLHYSGYMENDYDPNRDYYNERSFLYRFFKDYPSAFYWINLIFVFIILFFFSKIIKRWRALPEE